MSRKSEIYKHVMEPLPHLRDSPAEWPGGLRVLSPGTVLTVGSPTSPPARLLGRAGGGAGGGARNKDSQRVRGAGAGRNPAAGEAGEAVAEGRPAGRAGSRLCRSPRRGAARVGGGPNAGLGARHVAAHGPAAAAAAAVFRPRRTGRGPAGRCGRRGLQEGRGAQRVPAETGFGSPRGPPRLRGAEVSAGDGLECPPWLWGKEGGLQIQPQAGMVGGTV